MPRPGDEWKAKDDFLADLKNRGLGGFKQSELAGFVVARSTWNEKPGHSAYTRSVRIAARPKTQHQRIPEVRCGAAVGAGHFRAVFTRPTGLLIFGA